MSTDANDHTHDASTAVPAVPLRARVETLLALAESRRWPAVERAAEGTVSAEEIRAALAGLEP
jgi:hypothetical protein